MNIAVIGQGYVGLTAAVSLADVGHQVTGVDTDAARLSLPTLGDPYGLVVDEGMACSLPVNSTSAAGEIGDRIEDGVNGYIVPPEHTAALLERMELLALDPDLRARMGETSARKIAGHTPERWAEDFELAVERILSMPGLVCKKP